MKKSLLLLLAFVVLSPSFAFSQLNKVFIPYQAQGFKFLAAKSGSAVIQGFPSPTCYDDDWTTVNGAFGTLNNTSSPPCPLNDAAHVKTIWPSSRDILVRKHFTVPAGTRNARVSVAIDNNVQVFVNGIDVSGGIKSHNDCAMPENFVFNIPDNVLKTGDNVLAVRGIWVSSKNYLDVQVTGDVGYTINASAGANGAITPSGSVSVAPNANQAFVIAPSPGYRVAGVIVDGSSVGTVTSYTFSNVTANHTIASTFALNTFTIAASAGANGTITPSGSQTTNYGSSAAYTISPNSGYHIVDVLVDNVSVGAVGTYSFSNIASNHTISATFSINTYTINASAGANGTISPSGSQTKDYGTGATYTFTPSAGYHIAEVRVDNVSVGAVATYSFSNIAADHTISATFAINTYSISASAGANGTITPSGSQSKDYGSSATYAITANTGWHIADVIVDNGSVGAVGTYSFSNIGANHSISATFAINTYSISASAGANGTITPSGSQSKDYGSSATYAITSNTGWHIADVIVDNVSVGAVGTYSFSSISSDHTISATFAINTYNLSASAGANGSISPSGIQTVNYGTSTTFAVTPNTGYHVADVLVDGGPVGAITSYVFSSVSADHSIVATFAINTYSINASAGANGSISPSGSRNADHGSSLAFTITPTTGYHVADVLVDNVSVGALSSYTFADIVVGHSIAASFAINTYTISASAGANGSITPSGDQTVNYGSTPAFAIAPAIGYHVADVLVDNASVGPVSSHQFASVSAGHTISASFAINTYTIAASSGANGSLSSSGNVVVNYGSTQTFTIQALPGFHVETVVLDGTTSVISTQPTSQPGSAPWDVQNVTSDHSFSATFAENYYQLSVSSTPTLGTVSIEQPSAAPYPNYYKNGTVVTLRASTVNGYHFAGWTGVPADKLTTNPIDITMDSDKIVTATFEQNVPLTIVVTTINDVVDPNDGKISLREALNLTNGNAGVDRISFNITDGPGTGSKVIQLNQPLPPFRDAIVLDFTTQPGYYGVPLVTLMPSSTYPLAQYPNSNGIELGNDFLSFGYRPQRSIIRGIEIHGFPGSGIYIKSDSNIIQQNWIHDNGGDGVTIADGNGNLVGNVLNGPSRADGNRINANGNNGIAIKKVNAAAPPSGTTMLGNLIYSNARLGIDLGGDGTTPNKYPGGPTNPLVRPAIPDAVNFRVNYPTVDVATIADAQGSRVEGYLLSWPNTRFHIEAFLNDSPDKSGFGQGKAFIGSADVVTDADSAYAWFTIQSNTPLQWGQ
ncbi:hypothetical protein D4R75_00385, partial [bacterium]